MFEFGATSKKRAEGVNPLIFTCASRALAKSKYDMTIPWRGGKRTAEQQNGLFKDGNTKADGYDKLSYHQSGEALDIVPCADDPKTRARAFNYFAQLMAEEWQLMLSMQEVTGFLNWGGLFGSTGWDKPHFERREFT